MDLTKLSAASKTDWIVIAVSFLIPCLLSRWPVNSVVRLFYNHILDGAKSPVSGTSMKSWLEQRFPNRDLSEFRSDTAAVIGVSERWVYIFAIMFSQPSLITGVLILKAFFGWTDKTPKIDRTETHDEMVAAVAFYHTYVIGNLLSLVAAIVLALIGLYLIPMLLTFAGLTCAVC